MKYYRAQAEASIDFRTAPDAEAMKRALGPETGAHGATRAAVRVTRCGKITRIRFYATDLVALRAMVNSFLRFAATWRRVCDTMGPERERPKVHRI